MPLQTYNEFPASSQKGGSIRENLLDFLEILSPRDTPLYNNLGAISVGAGYVEYLEDTLNAAAVNAFIEGAPATDINLRVPTRNVSIVQNFQKHFWVSGRQAAVVHAGMASMISYQEMKAIRELKNDMELSLHRGSAVTGNTATAPQLAGLLNAIVTNATSSSGTTLTEFNLNNLLTLAYANPVNLREAYVPMKLKRTINQYTTSVTRYIPASDKRSFDIIDVYESEMGVVALFKSRYQLEAPNLTSTGNSFAVIDPDYFQVGWLRPLNTSVLGLDGDRERRMIVGEATLIIRSEKAGVVGKDFVAYVR